MVLHTSQIKLILELYIETFKRGICKMLNVYSGLNGFILDCEGASANAIY